MQDTAKYLVHADIAADGVVERSDVVGAIFGQTEGLLGDELDLRNLQQSSKVGRIDVDVDSENGQSFGRITIATGLDKVRTAILAASLETIDRVGPCRATVSVDDIEDVRAAKRREVVERATTLLSEAFEGTVLTSQELVEQVRRNVRVEDITEYEGFPAGPRVADSDAIILVEGRADVLTLLRYGIKNAIAVEGTNVPEPIAELTQDRTVTAFLDGDRGGDLILKELAQVGDVDYVAFAPPERSVEDLSRGEVMEALREKVPYDAVADAATPREAIAATDGSVRPAPPEADLGAPDAGTADASASTESPATSGTQGEWVDVREPVSDADAEADVETVTDAEIGAGGETEAGEAGEPAPAQEPGTDATGSGSDEGGDDEDRHPETLLGHVRAVVEEGAGTVRLLDEAFATLDEGTAAAAFDAIAEADPVPATAVIDAEVDQRVVDIAAQRGVELIVGRSTGDYVKQPTSVRVLTADEVLGQS